MTSANNKKNFIRLLIVDYHESQMLNNFKRLIIREYGTRI